MSLGLRILIGVVAGIFTGLFLGDLAAPFDVVGDIYVGLLQMTVLPYVFVSLILKIGKLNMGEAKTLSGQAGLVMLSLWAISLATVFVLPMSLPEWNAGSFFSSNLITAAPEFDFLGLYLPENPFHSLANNVVPAVVLFSILMGGALIGVRNKDVLLAPLGVVSDALGRIADFIVWLSPFGTFALAAAAAGQYSTDQFARLSGYMSTYTIGSLALAFLILPAFAAAISPFRFLQIIKGSRDAVLTAFATGKLFACLPMVIRDAKNILVAEGVPEEEAESTADVFVPLGYPFPNAGKILGILFIPFAAWFIGRPLELEQYPLLLSVGLFAFFGSPVAAVPFLLDLLRLPSDLFPLFLVAGLVVARIGDVVGAVHLLLFTILSSAWRRGLVRWSLPRLAAWGAFSVAVLAASMSLNNLIVSKSMANQGGSRDIVANMTLQEDFGRIILNKDAPRAPEPLTPNESRWERIHRTGEIRVGYVPNSPPFCYSGDEGKTVVGMDIDLVQRLAYDLETDSRLTVRLLPINRDDIPAALNDGRVDIAVGGITSTLANLGRHRESTSYLELHAALLVKDHRVRDFRTTDAMREAARTGGARIGYEAGGLLVRSGKQIPGIEAVEVPSAVDFVDGKTDIDALLITAEAGSVIAMMVPDFSVVIPEGIDIRVPAVFAVADDAMLRMQLDTWIRLRRDDGTVRRLYNHWILGIRPRSKTRRWSIIRDVLSWVE